MAIITHRQHSHRLRSADSRRIGHRWGRSGSRRRNTAAGADVVAATGCIVFRGQFVRLFSPPEQGLGVILLEEGNAPSATGSRAAALANLAGDPWLMNPDVIQNLSLRNVEAVANLIVKFQDNILPTGRLCFLILRAFRPSVPDADSVGFDLVCQTGTIEHGFENSADRRLGQF